MSEAQDYKSLDQIIESCQSDKKHLLKLKNHALGSPNQGAEMKERLVYVRVKRQIYLGKQSVALFMRNASLKIKAHINYLEKA